MRENRADTTLAVAFALLLHAVPLLLLLAASLWLLIRAGCKLSRQGQFPARLGSPG